MSKWSFKKLGKTISDSQSSIPEKRKNGENHLKKIVHDATDGAAYPGQAGKTAATEEAIITTAPEPAVTSESAALTEEEAATTVPKIATADPQPATTDPAVLTEEAISTLPVMIATDRTLKVALLFYLAQKNISELPPAIIESIASAASTSEVIAAVLPLGNTTLNTQLLHWAISNSSSEHEVSALQKIVFAYLADHPDDFSKVSELLKETDVAILANNIIDNDCGELSGNVIEFFLES